MQLFQTLKTLFLEAETNEKKFSNGNKTAGTRLRSNPMEIIAQSKALRKEVLATSKK